MWLWNWQTQKWEEGEADGLVVHIDASLDDLAVMERFGESIYGEQQEKNPIFSGTTYFADNWDGFADCLWSALDAIQEEILVVHHDFPKLDDYYRAVYFSTFGQILSERKGRGLPVRLRIAATSAALAERITYFLKTKHWESIYLYSGLMQISDLKNYIEETVTISAWLQDKSGKGKIQFLKLRDGSGFVQGTVFKDDLFLSEGVFETAKRLTQEQSLIVTGEVRADERAPGGVELSVQNVEIVAENHAEYPITPKEHGIEFLMEHRHLWLRHRRPWAIMRVRDCVQRGIVEFFHSEGFVRFDAPFFTPNAAEGTTELFEIDLFGEDKAYLAQTGQLYAEAGAFAFGKVYTFGPTFRAEKSKTRRHLLEFWMVEPEVAPSNHAQNMDLQERFVSHLVRKVLAECAAELELLGRDVSKLAGAAEGNYPRVTYTEALDIIRKHIEDKDLPPNVADDVQPVEWGDDLGAPHETILGHHFDRPVMIEKYPAAFKAFYMQPDPENPKVALCDDMIAPEGYGEIIGGSERIHDYDLLRSRIETEGLPLEAFDWYLDLRRTGSVPHAGFGMGLERVIAWITGIDHIREAIPFPRMLTRMRP